MTVATSTSPPLNDVETLADLLERLGSIPLQRIRFRPHPGTAREEDVLPSEAGRRPPCELVDGVLVEKPVGYYESRLAVVLIMLLEDFVTRHELGIVLGEAATLRLAPGLVRLPDVSFVSWSHFPDRLLPPEQMPDLSPDLAVEILSPGNTAAEMLRKRREYFGAGTRLVWQLDPADRTAVAYTGPERGDLVSEDGSLDGGDVLPGFTLPLRQWFAQAGPRRER